MKINKWVDFIDRVGWTFIQTLAATWIVMGADFDWDVLKAALLAAAISAAKTVVGQNTGNSTVGDVVPGASVVEGHTAGT